MIPSLLLLTGNWIYEPLRLFWCIPWKQGFGRVARDSNFIKVIALIARTSPLTRGTPARPQIRILPHEGIRPTCAFYASPLEEGQLVESRKQFYDCSEDATQSEAPSAKPYARSCYQGIWWMRIKRWPPSKDVVAWMSGRLPASWMSM